MGQYINQYSILLTLNVLLIILILIKLIRSYKYNNSYNKTLETSVKNFIGDNEFLQSLSEVLSNDYETILVLADGRGKNKFGNISAKICIGSFNKLFYNSEEVTNVNYFFKRTFNLCNKELLKHLDDYNGGVSLGSVIIKEGYLYYSVVGNIKITIFRNNELIPLSEGHTVNVIAEKKFYEGKITKEKALEALKDKRLLNYLGQDGFKEIEIYDTPIKLKTNDVVIVMNEGVHDLMPWAKLESVISKSYSTEEIVQEVITYLKTEVYEKRESATIIASKYLGG
jgi:PPM family protein phosphatase